MNQPRIDAIAKSIIGDVVSLQVIFDGTQGNREEAMTKLFTINRQARSLLAGKAEPDSVVKDCRSMVSEFRLDQLRSAFERGDLTKIVEGLTKADLSQLLVDLDMAMQAVNRALFNLVRNEEDGDGMAKPAA